MDWKKLEADLKAELKQTGRRKRSSYYDTYSRDPTAPPPSTSIDDPPLVDDVSLWTQESPVAAFSNSCFQASHNTYNISDWSLHSSVQARGPVVTPSESQFPFQYIPLDTPSHMQAIEDDEWTQQFLEGMPDLALEVDAGEGLSSLGENNAAQAHTFVGQGLDQYLQFVETLPDPRSRYGFDDGVPGSGDFGMFDQMGIWREELPGSADWMYEARASVETDKVYTDFLQAMPRDFEGEKFWDGPDFTTQDGFAKDSHFSLFPPVNQPAGVVQPELRRSFRPSVRNGGR